MSVRKQVPIASLCLLLIAFLLVACGGQDPAPTEPPPVDAPADDTPVGDEPAGDEPAEEPAGEEEEPAPSGQTSGRLVSLSWAGYEIPEFWGQFAEQYPDVEVDFSFLTESAEVYSRLQTGFEADLVHPCSNLWGLLVEEGEVELDVVGEQVVVEVGDQRDDRGQHGHLERDAQHAHVAPQRGP